MPLEKKQFGHYRILRLIGKGGMGEVYLIEDLQVKRQVAAKFIHLDQVQAGEPPFNQALRLFWREAMAIAQLDHPAILPLYDYGEAAIDNTSVAYLIMPYRPEGSLVTWLRTRTQTAPSRSLTLKQIAHLVQQASQALQYAHDHQIMHLDVKPANFLVRIRQDASEVPDLLLSDFGIARLTNLTSYSSQQVRGTPTYMAPEQCVGQPTFASDQYALAIMAYELLTGAPPFQGAPMQVMFAHVHEQPQSAHERNPLVPPAVDLTLLRALAKKPEERFPSVAAFAQAFQEALQGMEEATTLHVPNAPSVPSIPSSTVSSSDRNQSAPMPVPVPAVVFPEERMTPSPPPFTPNQAMTPLASQANLFPSGTAMHLPRSFPRALTSRPLVRVFVLILLAVAILGGGSFALYGAAASHLLWNTSHGALPPTSGGRAAGTQTSSTAQSNTSVPGKTWRLQNSGTSADLDEIAWWSSLPGGISRFVAVGGDSSTQTDQLLFSPDGKTWTQEYVGPYGLLGSVAWSGSMFVAVSANGGAVFISPDGKTWTQEGQITQPIDRVVWIDSQFIAVGEDEAIFTSPDGKIWTQAYIDTNSGFNLYAVAWSGSEFVAVGDGGTILMSPDGQTWTQGQSGGVQDFLLDVIRAGSLFVAVGQNDTIITSPDGKTWTPRWTSQLNDIGQRLNAVAWSGSLFVAVGIYGDANTILTSPDGKTWTPQLSGTSQELMAITWAEGQFVAVGRGGTVLTSP